MESGTGSRLGERLNALITEQGSVPKRPPSALVIGFSGRGSKTKSINSQYQPLSDAIRESAPELQAVLDDWLFGVYLLPDGVDGVEASMALSVGESLVNQQGDVFSRAGVVYHGENTSLHGVIERQQRLADLQAELPQLKSNAAKTLTQLKEDEETLANGRHAQQEENSKLKSAMHELHQMQLEISKQEQLREATALREKSLTSDIEAAKVRHAEQMNNLQLKEEALKSIHSKLGELEKAKETDEAARQQAELAFNTRRDAVTEAEKKHRESGFDCKIIQNNINEMESKVNNLVEESKAFSLRKGEAEKALDITPMETLKLNLTEAVTVKQTRETALSEARNQLEAQEAELKTLEQVRMQNEQALSPMRDKLEQSRLNEQEARLYFEQCQTGLEESGMDEEVLMEGLDEHAKASAYASKTNQLQKDIDNLGPVNLAAIQELDSEAERKTYLDSQMQDLVEASETLEGAINKIDRETREKLLATFNEANQHFGELFSTLFGGGQAKLELLGEEILDTGLQVFAQPPGKKNTTIQLLSGGEKALTALALVFALFRLNPAPFCLMDEVDAPLDDSNTERFCAMVKKMSEKTQFLFVSHNKITMEIAQQLIGVTMQESGVSRIVDVDIDEAMKMHA